MLLTEWHVLKGKDGEHEAVFMVSHRKEAGLSEDEIPYEQWEAKDMAKITSALFRDTGMSTRSWEPAFILNTLENSGASRKTCRNFLQKYMEEMFRAYGI